MIENNSSPHSARNYQGIVNAALMYLRTPTTSSQAAILVEGPDDIKIYRKFFNQNMTQIFACIGKNDLQKVLLGLLPKTDHLIGIRDADFCHLEDVEPECPNLFLTDCHDIEMTILRFAEVRRDLFSEYLSDDNFDRIDSVWKSIVKEASFVGYIRWFNEKNNYRIAFDGLFYKEGYGDDREQWLLDQLNERSPDKKESFTKEIINDFITTYKTDDIFNLCNGHDVTALLAQTFKINVKQVTRALRLSFHQKQFIRTALYREILAWQTQHSIAVLYSLSEEAAHA
ncbi:MAG: DUF4435 domain-containing protein [Dysgonamonadaceae bacterium]|nr:DUF4435 domain-containing protein [Dysgonamonadaceae bacterium]